MAFSLTDCGVKLMLADQARLDHFDQCTDQKDLAVIAVQADRGPIQARPGPPCTAEDGRRRRHAEPPILSAR